MIAIFQLVCAKRTSERGCFLFYLSFLLQTFTIHRTAGDGGGYLFNSSLPLQRHLDMSRTIIAENSPLHIPSSRIRTGNLWFPSASR